MTTSIPKPSEPLVGRDGYITTVWYDFLRNLSPAELSALIAQVATNTTAIAALEDAGYGDYLPASADILGVNSVRTYGELATGKTVQLDGDEITPAASHYYGTDESGVRGYHAMPDPPDQLFQRMDTTGDFRVTVDGSLRVTN